MCVKRPFYRCSGVLALLSWWTWRPAAEIIVIISLCYPNGFVSSDPNRKVHTCKICISASFDIWNTRGIRGSLCILKEKRWFLLLLLFREVGAQVEQFRQLVGSRVAVVRSCRHLSKQLGKWEQERRGSVVKGAISLPPKQSPGSRWPFAPQSFCLLRLPGVRVRQPVECTVVTEFLQRLLWFLIIPSRLCNKVRTRI